MFLTKEACDVINVNERGGFHWEIQPRVSSKLQFQNFSKAVPNNGLI